MIVIMIHYVDDHDKRLKCDFTMTKQQKMIRKFTLLLLLHTLLLYK